jgi:GRAM domain
MNTPPLPDENAMKDGVANMQRGMETVGGKLYLTDRRLIFEAHALNIQSGTTIIPLKSVTDARKCWTKFLNLIPLFPNSIAVSTKDGKEYRFVTFNRQAWLDAIKDCL